MSAYGKRLNLDCRKDKGLAFLLGLLNLAGVARLELATIGFGVRDKYL
jgi:hypothetical protein